jgi:hypothetical protein
MNNPKYVHIISSTLKTVASSNLVTEDELKNNQDKPLEEIFKLSNESKKTENPEK